MMAYQDDNSDENVDWKQRFEDLGRKMEDMSARVCKTDRRNSFSSSDFILRDSVRITQDINTKLAADVEIIKTEMTQLREKNAALNKTVSGLQRDVATVQAEEMTFREDLEAALTENVKLCTNVGVLQKENAKLREQVRELETGMQEMRCDVTVVQKDLVEANARLCEANVRLAAEKSGRNSKDRRLSMASATSVETIDSVASIRPEANVRLSAEKSGRHNKERRPSMASAISVGTIDSVASLRPEVEVLHTKGSELVKTVASQKREVDKLRQEVSTLQGKNGEVLADLSIIRSEAQTFINGFRTQLRELQTFVGKSNVLVAFHACLSQPVTTTRMEILVCDNIISNVGAAYDPRNGVFTAPVPGIYAFFANTSPCQRDQEKKARLSVVLENRRIAHVYARGLWWSSGHTALHLEAGHRVWLRTFDDDRYTFSEGWTNFTGMLIQSQA
ncbi:uncharacterized protein [Littorina saxatilis]|uniref:uncharacterized protein n=1 Tax=Littorina saxatilis TaxID=31220 RepID=UPI0038B69149